MSGTLVVLIADRLTHLMAKGEITDRYYNPGEVFSTVHLVLINDDRPDLAALQRTVGTAHLFVHNLPIPGFVRSLAWRRVGAWLDHGCRQIAEMKPALIRCYGTHLHTTLAARVKATLGVPYCISLHLNPDADLRGRESGLRERIINRALAGIERDGLLEADLVLPVYRPIVPYLERLGIRRYEVAYNVINPTHLVAKTSYVLSAPPRIISVGRQFSSKDPRILIRALAEVPDCTLTLVGTGELHAAAQELSRTLGLEQRIRFIPALANDALCLLLAEHDLFAVHSQFWELSKSVIEALLTGMPTIINRRHGSPVPELEDAPVRLVSSDSAGFATAFCDLLADHSGREALGRQARQHALEHWGPERCERRIADIHRELAQRGTP